MQSLDSKSIINVYENLHPVEVGILFSYSPYRRREGRRSLSEEAKASTFGYLK